MCVCGCGGGGGAWVCLENFTISLPTIYVSAFALTSEVTTTAFSHLLPFAHATDITGLHIHSGTELAWVYSVYIKLVSNFLKSNTRYRDGIIGTVISSLLNLYKSKRLLPTPKRRGWICDPIHLLFGRYWGSFRGNRAVGACSLTLSSTQCESQQ
jgi:hypothetical protein